jgi:hypothetical protein
MPWLWQPNSPVGQPNGLGPPMLNYAAPPNPAAPTVGQGVAQTAADVAQAWPSVEEQRRMLQPLPGWQGTAVDAAKQWAEGVMMGTTAPGEAPGFSLEKVQRRRFAPPNEHIWQIKDPAGGDAGTIDTTWNPDTGNLHIEDFQSEGGPNTLGPAAIRQLRSALLEQYPGVQSLSGLRISGATYAHTNSGSGPGRYASQSIQDVEPAAATQQQQPSQ